MARRLGFHAVPVGAKVSSGLGERIVCRRSSCREHVLVPGLHDRLVIVSGLVSVSFLLLFKWRTHASAARRASEVTFTAQHVVRRGFLDDSFLLQAIRRCYRAAGW